MNYLLDTCIISEFFKSAENAENSVVERIRALPSENLYLSVVTAGEIIKGIEELKTSRKKADLQKWFHGVISAFSNRILPFTLGESIAWGKFEVIAKNKGHNISTPDIMIAATALCQAMTIVTRNSKDFKIFGLDIIDPWKA